MMHILGTIRVGPRLQGAIPLTKYSTTSRSLSSSGGSLSKELRVCESVEGYREFRRSLRPDMRVGFIPTMGALHHGHLELMRKARKENDIVVASIFVNPTQFGPNEDYTRYPRPIDEDLEKLRSVSVDCAFTPNADVMYGKDHRIYVQPEGFDTLSEGSCRPGHFRGVCTIVAKLFNIIQPSNAYFGQKDAMQCVVINRLVKDLNFDINIVTCPTTREADGLAMSSRNAYLDKEARAAAPVVYKALRAAEKLFREKIQHDSAVSAGELRKAAMDVLKREKLISEIQYVSFGSKETMAELQELRQEGAIVSTAVKLGSVRLIDNIIM